jgi:hypothetical protein
MINTKLQSIIDTKSAIGNAIVNKGGTITGETPFFNYAAQIDGISTGTPQTIFTASDGSKWALTNAVNLVNDAGNVISDFNYWQPANNSTSDPILNVGTVGANISGNIQLVPVNQVNISQYENIVINDTTGAKYVGYNGYDSVTNPTPTGNTTFNRWLLNNSASGTIIFANTTVVSGGTFNGPNSSIDEANMAFINNTASYGSEILATHINNGFIYVGGVQFAAGLNRGFSKYHEGNLVLVGNSVRYHTTDSGNIRAITSNDGFIYIGGTVNQTVQKFGESNLVRVGNTNDYGGAIRSIVVNNGFIYTGGEIDRTLKKYHEGNLAFVANTASYGASISDIVVNDGFVYVGGESNAGIYKYHESNLAFVGNTTGLGYMLAMSISNGFIYAGGTSTGARIHKYHESNLAFVGNITDSLGIIRGLTTANGFIYSDSSTNTSIHKFYESNLAFVNNTASYNGLIFSVIANNGFVYASGHTTKTATKYQQNSLSLESLTFYTATKIKE